MISECQRRKKNRKNQNNFAKTNIKLAGSKLVLVSVATMKIKNQWRGSDVARMKIRHVFGFNF
jgi:hypothetical protein